MSPIQTQIVSADNLAVLTLQGRIGVEDIIQALGNFYTYHSASRILWDLNQADLRELTVEHLKEVLSIGNKKGHLKKRTHTAIVASQPLAYALARQISSLVESYGKEFVIMVFRDHQAALAWLGEQHQ